MKFKSVKYIRTYKNKEGRFYLITSGSYGIKGKYWAEIERLSLEFIGGEWLTNYCCEYEALKLPNGLYQAEGNNFYSTGKGKFMV